MSVFHMFGEPSPEQQAQWQAQQTDAYNKHMGFLNSLKQEQLEALIEMVVRGIHDKAWLRAQHGVLYGRLYYDFQVCMCMPQEHKRSDHMDPDWIVKQGQTSHTAEPNTDELKTAGNIADEPYFKPVVTDFENGAPGAELTARTWLEVWIEDNPAEASALNHWLYSHGGFSLHEYDRLGLEDIYQLDHDDTPGSTRVRCRRCEFEFTSLEDRMLKLPDTPPLDINCIGCLERSAHG